MNLRYPVRTLIGIIAIILSIEACFMLISLALVYGTILHVVSFAIYGLSLTALWTISTLFHTLNLSKEKYERLEQYDLCMIYLMIAGTYTPICVILLYGLWGWSLLSINWGLALICVILRLYIRKPPVWATTVFFLFYLIMGWMIVVAWEPLTKALPPMGLFWLVLGGILFTVGALIFKDNRLKFHSYFAAHEIWHLCVLAGSFCHFWLMLKFVL